MPRARARSLRDLTVRSGYHRLEAAGKGERRAGKVAQPLDDRLRATFEQAAVGLTHTDPDGRFLRANPKFCRMLGYSEAEVLSMPPYQLTHPDERGMGAEGKAKLIEGTIDSVSRCKRYLHRDGHAVWCRLTLSLARGEDGRPDCFIGVVEDISAQLQVEQQMKRVARARRVMAECNHVLVHAQEESAMLAAMCRIVVESGGYVQSWVGLAVDDAEKSIAVAGEWGYPDGYLCSIRRTWSTTGSGNTSMMGRAIASGDHCLAHYPRTDRAVGAQQMRAQDRGYQASITLPLIDEGKVIGGISIYARESDAFDEGEIALLTDLAEDIAFGINTLRTRAAHQVIEQRFAATFNQAAVGIAQTGLDGRYLMVNDKFCEMVGYSREELVGQVPDLITHPDDMHQSHLNRQRLCTGKDSRQAGEKRYIRKDGRVIWVRRTASLAYDKSGKAAYSIRVIEDITDRKQAEEAVMRDRTLLRTVVDNLPDRIYVKDNEGRYLLMNRIAKQVHGVCEDDEIAGRTAYDCLPETVASVIAKEDRDIIEHRSPIVDREKCLPSTLFGGCSGRPETSVWQVTTKVPLLDKTGNVFGIVGVNRDITAQKRAVLALAESERKFRQLAENIPEVFWITDVAQRETLYVSAAFERITGRPAGESAHHMRFWLRAVHPEDRRRVYRARKALPDVEYNIEYRIVRPDGTIRWIHDQAFPVADGGNRTYRIAGIAADITRRKEAEEKLMHMAHYDALTGLPNRVLFYDRLNQNLAHALRHGSLVSVMFIDLDRFKVANDTLGHAVGDALLKQVSRRLEGCVRKCDTVARLSGDEFGAILGDLHHADDVRTVARKVLDALGNPFNIDGHELYVTASVGISMYPADGGNVHDLLKNADTAMYRAKEAGRNTFRFYTEDMNIRTVHQLEMENGLRKAVERCEFLLHYQPKVDLRSGDIVGFEALLRWQRPGDAHLVSPAEFVPLLEETGLILPVGEWLIDAACAQISAWRQEGIEPRPIAINLSARQFADKSLADVIRRALDMHWVDSSLIELEITESSLMNNTEEAVATMRYLKSLGLRISLDDFGTGYSSLSYLKRFPLDALKIDRSFVRDITTDEDDATITLAVIGMAHRLGLKVIAEGVESEEQLAFLSRNRCDEMQGYYFSRPVSPGECGAMLSERRRLVQPEAARETDGQAEWRVYDDKGERTLPPSAFSGVVFTPGAVSRPD